MAVRRAYIAIIVAIVGVSFASIFIRWSESHALVKATYRMAFASLILLPLALGTRRREIANLGRRDLLIMLGIGIVLAIHFSTWISSLDYTTVASSVILVNSHPLIVALISHYLLRERVPGRAVLGVILGFAGVLIIALGDLGEGTGLLGDALAFIGAVMAALYIIGGRRLRQRVSLIPYVFVVYSATTFVLLLTTLALGPGVRPGSDVARELLLFLALAVVSTILGHTLYNWALKYVKAPVVSAGLLGEPVGATLLALLLLAEVPSFTDMMGGVLALVGIYITARGMEVPSSAEPAG
jgi:drug/metabolite transporter (DMT)-like permease